MTASVFHLVAVDGGPAAAATSQSPGSAGPRIRREAVGHADTRRGAPRYRRKAFLGD
jgi:hypothetical protein